MRYSGQMGKADERVRKLSVVSSGRSFGALAGIAFLLSLSFFARHAFGVAISGRDYTPLVYNSASLLSQSPTDYSFKPDDGVWDETRAYARYTQEILRGEFLGANGGSFDRYLAEGSLPETFWYRDRLGPAILALVAVALGHSVPEAFLVADFAFPFFIALVLLILCRKFFAFPLGLSLFATASIMWLNWGDVVRLYDSLSGQLPNGATFLRTPYPQLSFLTFSLFVAALMNFHQRSSRHALIFVGGGLLVNFYTYFYAWTPAIVIAGLYALANTHEKTAVRILNSTPKHKWLLWFTLLVVLALSSPVWVTLVSSGDIFRDSFVRVFGSYTHMPDLRRTLLIAPFLAVAIGLSGSVWPTRWMWVIFWTSFLIVLNQQVVTGKVDQPVHWTGGMIEPFAVLFLLDIAFRFWNKLEDSPKAVKPLADRAIPIVATMAVIGVLAQTYYVCWVGAKVAAPYNRTDQRFSGLIAFMDAPGFRKYGFLSNDPYLQTVLPAYIVEKPLMPWYNDPLTTRSIIILQTAASEQFGTVVGSLLPSAAQDNSIKLRFDDSKVLFVLNRHRMTYSGLPKCQVRFENADFIVAVAQKCTTS